MFRILKEKVATAPTIRPIDYQSDYPVYLSVDSSIHGLGLYYPRRMKMENVFLPVRNKNSIQPIEIRVIWSILSNTTILTILGRC